MSKLKRKSTSEESQNSKKTKQEDVDQLIIGFISDALVPFGIVENSSFKLLMKKGFPRKTLIDRKQAAEGVLQEFLCMKNSLIETFKGIKYICITADCWTMYHR